MSATRDAFMKKQDETIRENVVRQIHWTPEIRSKDIIVTVADRNLQLNGFVHTYMEKSAAESAAKQVYGVLCVANEIAVKPEIERTDPEITRDVVDALRLNSTVPATGLKITVREGLVTLEGAVSYYYERRNAECSVQVVGGVKGVINRIAIHPATVSSDHLKEKIEETWKRTIDLDARFMYVAAQDGIVDLYGHVHSWAEKEKAERAAWQAPGVLVVRNHLQISL